MEDKSSIENPATIAVMPIMADAYAQCLSLARCSYSFNLVSGDNFSISIPYSPSSAPLYGLKAFSSGDFNQRVEEPMVSSIILISSSVNP